MADEIQKVARALNQVRSVGQAKAAAGECLNACHRAYALLDGMSIWSNRADLKRELDVMRARVESNYYTLSGTAGDAVNALEWGSLRDSINDAYVTIAGIEGADPEHFRPVTSNGDILLQSIREAPGVFGKAVGETVAAVGNTAGQALGGVFSGLGWWAPVLIAIVALISARKLGYL